MHPDATIDIANQHAADLLAEATKARLVASAHAGHVPLGRRIRVAAGAVVDRWRGR